MWRFCQQEHLSQVQALIEVVSYIELFTDIA